MPAGEQGTMVTLSPLTNDLIIQALASQNYHYFTDDDGDIGGWWDKHLFYFFRLGDKQEVLQIRARIDRQFSVDEVPRLHELCNEWNHDRLWPKAYIHVADDGTAQVYGEVLIDLEAGATPDQLLEIIECGLSTGCQLGSAVMEW